MQRLQGSGSSLPGKHTKPNPTGMLVLSLVHQKGREEGGQLPAPALPAGHNCECCSGSHSTVWLLCSTRLWVRCAAQGGSREGQEHKAAREKMHLHAAETQNAHGGGSGKQQKQSRAAVRRKTCKTKKAHKLQQKIRRAYTFFPQAVLKEANHGKGFFSPLLR